MTNSKKSKINTHKLLEQYHYLTEWPSLARKANELAKEGKDEANILETIEELVLLLEISKEQMKKSPASMRIFTPRGETIPIPVIDQLRTALSIPPAIRGALMPDGHLGYSMPIGGVIALENSISPAYIGRDIACMVQLTTYDIFPQDFEEHRTFFADALKEATSFGVGSMGRKDIDDSVMNKYLWDELPILKENKDMARAQLGSSGAGNHFADLVLGKTLQDTPVFEFAGETFVGLLTHSGSRGIGYRVAQHYMNLAEKETAKIATGIPKGHGWLSLESELGQEYWEVMQLMGTYARANHGIIHDHFATFANNPIETTQLFSRHNFAWKDDEDKTTIIHRKGATPAHKEELGLIPGTSGTPSYVTEGLGNDEALNSSSHGAGRNHSRTMAKALFEKAEFDNHMATNKILHTGIDTDETFKAYKDIEKVMLAQDGTILNRVAQLDPAVVIMGGKEIGF